MYERFLLFVEGEGTNSIFLLRKKNYTTEKAVQTIADSFNIKRNRIGYAGLKDKYAITEQFISIKMFSPKKKIDSFSLKDIDLEFVGFSKNPISIGL